MKTSKDVTQFCYMTRNRDIVAAIDIVEVCGDAGKVQFLNAVQQILRRTINISCLTLLYFEPTLHVLPMGQTFNNLTYLNINAPHTTVAQFLRYHTEITSLVVTTACNGTLAQSKYLRAKQSHGFP